MSINKATLVRQVLVLTPTECGKLLLGCNAKQAYDIWSRWERGDRNPTRATEKMFDIILALKMAQDLNTPGADRALELVVKLLSDDESPID